jgi:hypothetical protein
MSRREYKFGRLGSAVAERVPRLNKVLSTVLLRAQVCDKGLIKLVRDLAERTLV